MKKLNLKELQDLVSEVDYISPLSYPILFSVINTESKDLVSYEVGLGRSYDKASDLFNNALGLDGDLQYLAIVDNSCDDGVYEESYLDVQDPDCMVYEAIGEMLRKKCKIDDEKTIIVLHQRDSFSGDGRGITYDLLSEGVIKEMEELIDNSDLIEED